MRIEILLQRNNIRLLVFNTDPCEAIWDAANGRGTQRVVYRLNCAVSLFSKLFGLKL
uniref:Uncharacterized protein n=1 Tax=Physcomitrium patens TaxID=3218 RepID=A0A2K1L090_PHYPA|nr:hypothetical protein PHYPA_002232 [Physcomitrium patens]